MTIRAVDLFAGAGGMSAGARAADVETVWAGNHWPAACETYGRNHGVPAVCQDLMQANWHAVPRHDLLMAAPACQGHSPARGKERPHHDSLRSTAWAVVQCAEVHRPAFVLVENVPAFQDWILYPAWKLSLRKLGYALAPMLIDSADHGVPQNRRRLYVLATRSRARIRLKFDPQPHQPFGPCVDWGAGAWTAVDRPGRSPKTLARVAAGRARFGERFVMPYYSSGSGLTGRSLDRPLGTVTTVDRWAVVNGNQMRMLIIPESKRAMGYPDTWALPPQTRDANKMLGNGVNSKVITDVLVALRRAA